MAFLTVTVAGTDRTANLCAPSSGGAATFSEALRERKTFNCSFLSRDGSWKPRRGQHITVEHSTEGALFGGFITNAIRRKAAGSSAIFTAVTCVSYEQILTRRYAAAFTYKDTAAGDIFTQIATDSLGGEGFTVEVETGPVLPLFDIQEPRPKVAEAYDRLCELASNGTDIYYWDAPAKVVRFFKQGTYPAPFSITDAHPYVLGTEGEYASVNETNQGIVNRLFVFAGQYLRDAVTEDFVGDGATRTFDLAYPCGAKPTISVNGVDVGDFIGVDGADTGKQWYWTLGSTRIRQDDLGTLLTSGDTLSVTYQGLDKRSVGPFDDADSASAEGVLQGDGTGVYEAYLQIDTPQGGSDVGTLAQAYLDRFSQATVTFKAATFTAGLRSGQELVVNLTDLDINLTMLVQSVTMTDVGAGHFLWSFTAIYGAARDDWKRSLLGKSQTASIVGLGAGAVPIPSDGTAVDPSEFTIGTLSARWIEILRQNGRDMPGSRRALQITIPATAPGGTAQGGHIYVENPDQSSNPSVLLDGTTPLDGTYYPQGTWTPQDFGQHPTAGLPWTITIPDASPGQQIRVYVQAYSDQVDAAPIQAGLASETPSALVRVPEYQADKVGNGLEYEPNVKLVSVTKLPDVNNTGKLRTPIAVKVDTAVIGNPAPDGWACEVLMVWDADPDQDLQSPAKIATGTFSFEEIERYAGILPAGADEINDPHTLALDTPTSLLGLTIYVRSLKILSQTSARGGAAETTRNRYLRNTVVPGVTPSAHITMGTTSGTVDMSAAALDSFSDEFHVVDGEWQMRNVDMSKASRLSDQFAYDSTTGVQKIVNLAAELIITGQLQVGGQVGRSRPPLFKGFDLSGNLMWVMGDDRATPSNPGGSGYIGAWFKGPFAVGGTNPFSPKMFCDSAGNMAISGSLIVGAVGSANSANIAVTINGTIQANQVSAGQFNGLALQLTKNGVTTTIDNIFDSGDGGYVGAKFRDDSTPNWYSIASPHGFALYGQGPFGPANVAALRSLTSGGFWFGRFTLGRSDGLGNQFAFSGSRGTGVTVTDPLAGMGGNGQSIIVSFTKPGGATGTMTFVHGWLVATT
jgi:hypothetical protein